MMTQPARIDGRLQDRLGHGGDTSTPVFSYAHTTLPLAPAEIMLRPQ